MKPDEIRPLISTPSLHQWDSMYIIDLVIPSFFLSFHNKKDEVVELILWLPVSVCLIHFVLCAHVCILHHELCV